jgi:hypothetical protein
MCKTMKILVFSKNRACQLELLLRSLNRNVTILFTCDKEYESGYNKVISMYPNMEFIYQHDFKKDVIRNLSKHIMFLCDDDVMVNPFDDSKEFSIFEENDDILSLSLRLAPYYNTGNPINFKENNTWNWNGCWRSWGYPMSVSSTIFREEDIFLTIANSNFNNPIELEVALRINPPNKPYMMCCDKPYFINNLANQNTPKYGHYKTSRVSLKELNDLFLEGKRISLKDIKEKAKKATYCFIKEKYEYETY